MKRRNFLSVAAVCGTLALTLVQPIHSQAPPISGGFAKQSVEDAEVKEMAEAAVRIKAKELNVDLSLTAIRKAESQVVAGRNFRLCIETYIPSEEPMTDGVIWYIHTVIHKDLSGEVRITVWKEDENGCEDPQ